jgi:hypothetical protein
VHASSGQGVPWRCSTTVQPADVAWLIDELIGAAAPREVFVAEMHDLGVHKTHLATDAASLLS